MTDAEIQSQADSVFGKSKSKKNLRDKKAFIDLMTALRDNHRARMVEADARIAEAEAQIAHKEGRIRALMEARASGDPRKIAMAVRGWAIIDGGVA